jgi:Tfp pilus assembly protein PilV
LLQGYIILQIAQRKKWDPERMEAATEAIRNKEMGSYKASKVFNVQQTTLGPYVKDRKKCSSETVKTKLGRKQVLTCEAESDLAAHLERKFLA